MDRARSFKLAVVMVFFAGVPAVLAYSAGPPAAHTGAPGELTCRECHNTFALNSGPGQLTLEGVPATYDPGATYTITVRISHPDRRRWGFEISAYTDALDTAGTFAITDAGRTQIKTEDGMSFVEQRNQGTDAGKAGGTAWSFKWNAPPAGTGLVTFYAAGNASNNDGTVRGDNIYTAFAESQPSVAVAPFVDVTSAAGLDPAAGGDGLAWADVDLDGDLDVFVSRSGQGLLYRNTGGQFAEVGASLGLAAVDARGAAWGDVDNDGRADLLVATGAGPRLYRNTASGFVDATAGLPASGAALFGAWADYDADGSLDLLLGLESGAMLLHNDGTGLFADETAAAGVAGVTGVRAAAWADYDGDGRIDLFVATSDAGRLFHQRAAGVFDDVSTTAGLTGAGNARDAAWADYDGDFDLDLFVLGDSALTLFSNDGDGTYTDVTSSVGLGGLSGRALAIDDADGDGHADVLVTGPGLDRLMRFDLTVYEDFTDKTGLDDVDGRAATWADYDGDGHVDLLSLTESGIQLWRNPSLAATVTVRALTDADGDASDSTTATDRDALGAVVALDDNNNFATGFRQMRVIDGGGRSSQAPPRAVFATLSNANVGVRATFSDGEGRQTAVTAAGAVSVVLRDPRAAAIETVSYKRKDGTDKLIVNGQRFVTDDEVVEVNAGKMGTTKYPKKKQLGDGTSTRIVGTDPNFNAVVPAGRQVRVTTYDESSGIRSAPYLFTR